MIVLKVVAFIVLAASTLAFVFYCTELFHWLLNSIDVVKRGFKKV